MKVELNIYNSILFGDLRPWLQDNQSQETFKQQLNDNFRFEDGNIIKFEKALTAALKTRATGLSLACAALFAFTATDFSGSVASSVVTMPTTTNTAIAR